MAVDSCKVIQTTNMAARYHSPEAVSLRSTFKVLRTDYIKKDLYSNLNTRNFLNKTTFHHVEELDDLLHRDSVRGNRDPKTWIPEVNSDSPAGILLKRLRRQIKAVRILAEMVHDGPPANESENALLSRARERQQSRDGHHSEYSAERLLDEIVKKTQLQSSIEAWDNTLKTSLPRLNYSTNFSFKNFGNLFVKYGFVIVDGVEKTAEATEKFCRELGPIQNTFFGDFWVFSNEGQNNNHEDTAYGNETIGPHTDGTYLDQSPGIQVFHCLHPAAKGGNTVLTDGFKCAKLLRQQFPDFYMTLTTFEIDHHYLEGKKGKRSLISRASNKRVIETDIDDYLRQIRFNPYDRAPFSFVNGRYTVSEVITFYKAYTEFSRICHDHTLSIDLHLEPGSVIFIDNHRVFHSRTSFTGFRKMAGCYMSRDNLLAKIRPNLDSFII